MKPRNAKWEVAGRLVGENSGECVLADNRPFTTKCMNNGENVVERSVNDKEISFELEQEGKNGIGMKSAKLLEQLWREAVGKSEDFQDI